MVEQADGADVEVGTRGQLLQQDRCFSSIVGLNVKECCAGCCWDVK